MMVQLECRVPRNVPLGWSYNSHWATKRFLSLFWTAGERVPSRVVLISHNAVSHYVLSWCTIFAFLTAPKLLSGNFVYNANTVSFTVLLRITCNPPSQDLWTQMNLKIWQLLYVLITESLCHTQLCTFKKEGKNVTFVAPRIPTK